MDPEANMRRQIELAMEIIALDDSAPEIDSTAQQALAWRGAELAELVLALHEWKQKGGAT